MIMLQRKIRCKYTGNDNYMPKDSKGNPLLSRERWIPVIGYEIRRREKIYDGKIRVVEDIYLVVINDNQKVETIASFNCHVLIDDQAEWNFSKLTDMLNNISVMIKVLSERFWNAKEPKKQEEKRSDK